MSTWGQDRVGGWVVWSLDASKGNGVYVAVQKVTHWCLEQSPVTRLQVSETVFVCLFVCPRSLGDSFLVGRSPTKVGVRVPPGVCDVGAPTSPGHLYHGGRSDHRASSQADLSWGDGKERALGPGPMDRGVFVGHKEGVADHWFPCTVGVLKKRETHTWS